MTNSIKLNKAFVKRLCNSDMQDTSTVQYYSVTDLERWLKLRGLQIHSKH